MLVRRSMMRLTPALMMFLLAPTAVWAQNRGWGNGRNSDNGRYGDNGRNSDTGNRELFQWTGRVDREVQISMRDDNVWTRSYSGSETGRARSRVESRLPQSDGYVSVRVLSGRGDVQVVQQPSSRNDYTTVVRVRDAGGGSDQYRIAAYWQGSGYGTWDGNRRSPRVDTRDRDGDDDDNGYGRRGNGGYGSNGNGGYGNGGYGSNGNGGYGSGSGTLHWSGAVDGELELRIQGRSVDYQTLSGNRPMDVRSDVSGRPLGNGSGGVQVRSSLGRGSVTVVQQPSSYNGYTAVIRVRDPQGGYGRYDFDVIWR